MSDKEHDPKRRWILKGVGGTILAGLGGGGAALRYNVGGMQSGLLFHPNSNLDGDPIEPMKSPQEYGLSGINERALETRNNETLLVWKTETIDPEKPTLILFPGSVGHLGDTHMHKDPNAPEKDAYIRVIKEAQARGMQVIAANHVGFAGSNTKPATQEGIYRGAQAVIDYALSCGIKPDKLNITGISMGTMIASHAAVHLMQSKQYAASPEQNIHLTLVSGTMSTPHGAKDQRNIPLGVGEALLHGQTFSETENLKALSAVRKRANITFVRGKDDNLTPAYHASEHAKAAGGTDFKAFVVPGTHFPDEKLVLDAVEGKTANMETEKLDVGILTRREGAVRKTTRLGRQ